MKIPSYNAPLLPQYREPFIRRTLKERYHLESAIFGDRRFAKDNHSVWVRFNPEPRPNRNGPEAVWQPKLYLCLQPRDYWATLEKLVRSSGALGVRWKFYAAPLGFERPDKIVFYPESERELMRLSRRLAGFLNGCRGHGLCHAGPVAAKPGLLYSGCDPTFIEPSWRMYRCLANAWASINTAYLGSRAGGIKGWYARMNLSMDHEGPAQFAPRLNQAFIKRQWRLIHPA